MEWAILHAFRKHSPNGVARARWCTSGSAYYSSIDPERTKGWVGLVGWPYSGWFTYISGHPSATGWAWDRESSPVKDRRSTTVPRSQQFRPLKSVMHSQRNARPMIVFSATKHFQPLTSTKLYWLVLGVKGCKQLAHAPTARWIHSVLIAGLTPTHCATVLSTESYQAIICTTNDNEDHNSQDLTESRSNISLDVLPSQSVGLVLKKLNRQNWS